MPEFNQRTTITPPMASFPTAGIIGLGSTSRRRLLVLVGLALALGCLVPEPAQADITVKPTANGYDIDITSETTASELMDAIAHAAGIEIKGEPAEATVGTNHLRNASLERALRQLLPKAPFVVRFDADEAPTEIIFLSPQKGGEGNDDGADASDEDSLGDESSSDPAALPYDAGAGTAPITPPASDPAETDPTDEEQ